MRMVTRTIKHVVVATKCIHTATMEVEDLSFTLPARGELGEKEIARLINKMLDADGGLYKLVKIVGFTEETNRFGMPEETFIKNATVIE